MYIQRMHSSTGLCYFTPHDNLCDDSVYCTVDKCDQSIGKCSNIANHGRCDNSNPCTIDTCNGDNSCYHDLIDCDDEIPCTIDYCNVSSGLCQHMSDNSLCDDKMDCTIDVCDQELGRCDNIPSDFLCEDGIACTENKCNQAEGTCDIWYVPNGAMHLDARSILVERTDVFSHHTILSVTMESHVPKIFRNFLFPGGCSHITYNSWCNDFRRMYCSISPECRIRLSKSGQR